MCGALSYITSFGAVNEFEGIYVFHECFIIGENSCIWQVLMFMKKRLLNRTPI